MPSSDGEKNLKPFKKADPRINRNGRPKSFPALRTLAQEIAHEKATGKTGEPLEAAGHLVTVAEVILRRWAASQSPMLQIRFMEVAFGKVPDVGHLDIDMSVVSGTVDDWREGDKARRAEVEATMLDYGNDEDGE